MNPDIRWSQRFQNYERALSRLSEPLLRDFDRLSALEKEGTVQRFEYTLELAWKTVKDYLENEGQVLQPVTARDVPSDAGIAVLAFEATADMTRASV